MKPSNLMVLKDRAVAAEAECKQLREKYEIKLNEMSTRFREVNVMRAVQMMDDSLAAENNRLRETIRQLRAQFFKAEDVEAENLRLRQALYKIREIVPCEEGGPYDIANDALEMKVQQ